MLGFQVAPAVFSATLREYSDVIGAFLGLPHAEGYLWTPERQQLLGSTLGHSEGQVRAQHSQPDLSRCPLFCVQFLGIIVSLREFISLAEKRTMHCKDSLVAVGSPSSGINMTRTDMKRSHETMRF